MTNLGGKGNGKDVGKGEGKRKAKKGERKLGKLEESETRGA